MSESSRNPELFDAPIDYAAEYAEREEYARQLAADPEYALWNERVDAMYRATGDAFADLMDDASCPDCSDTGFIGDGRQERCPCRAWNHRTAWIDNNPTLSDDEEVPF